MTLAELKGWFAVNRLAESISLACTCRRIFVACARPYSMRRRCDKNDSLCIKDSENAAKTHP
jgi:hypothetical protein